MGQTIFLKVFLALQKELKLGTWQVIYAIEGEEELDGKRW